MQFAERLKAKILSSCCEAHVTALERRLTAMASVYA